MVKHVEHPHVKKMLKNFMILCWRTTNSKECVHKGLEQTFARSVTMDASRMIHLYDVETKCKVKSGQRISLSLKKFKIQPSTGKVIVSVFWDNQGVILADLLQKRATVTGVYYANSISKFHETIKNKHLGGMSKSVNAPSHTPAIAEAAIVKTGFELVQHPPSEPDLTLGEFL